MWRNSVTIGAVPALQRHEVNRLLHGSSHHAQHDLRRLDVLVVPFAPAVGMTVLVRVLALEEPRRRRPVLVARQGGSPYGRE